jgi:hypothetical protein
MEHIEEIVGLVYQYLKVNALIFLHLAPPSLLTCFFFCTSFLFLLTPSQLLRSSPVDRKVFEELKTMSEIKFLFREKENAVDFASGSK